MNHPITVKYVLLKSGGNEYAFMVHRSNKSGLRITRAVTPSLLEDIQQLVLKAPGSFRLEQVNLFAHETSHNYGTLPRSAVWGTLAQLEALWQATDLQVQMPQDAAYWTAFISGAWDPKPMSKIGHLFTVATMFESKASL